MVELTNLRAVFAFLLDVEISLDWNAVTERAHWGFQFGRQISTSRLCGAEQ